MLVFSGKRTTGRRLWFGESSHRQRPAGVLEVRSDARRRYEARHPAGAPVLSAGKGTLGVASRGPLGGGRERGLFAAVSRLGPPRPAPGAAATGERAGGGPSLLGH